VVFLTGNLIHHKNTQIETLKDELAAANSNTRAAKGQTNEQTKALVSFVKAYQATIKQLAQHDMVETADDAAGIGGAVATGCAPGYRDPSCDWWYESTNTPLGAVPYSRRWSVQALKQFAIWEDLQTYGQDLVRRALKYTPCSEYLQMAIAEGLC